MGKWKEVFILVVFCIALPTVDVYGDLALAYFHLTPIPCGSQHWAIINFDKNTSNVTILNRNGEWKFGDDLLNSWNITWTLNFPDNTRGCR